MATQLSVDIVTPDGRAFEGEARGVQAPGIEGSFEVLRNHAPMIAAFEVGKLVVKTKDAYEDLTARNGRIEFATSGGFLEVLDNRVIVLAETAEPSSDIDTERAKKAEQRALRRLDDSASPEEREEAEAALTRARNRLRVSMGGV
ncbi:MAG: ATP synthase F1 subunit epsilon [Longimonas sp.]|uniref:ATP synthase F1 subunit epsilon n=1 Tax=Longimonas sp. TaxID=2039626 RepID=UPI0039763E74